jgi:hypothetical protein
VVHPIDLFYTEIIMSTVIQTIGKDQTEAQQNLTHILGVMHKDMSEITLLYNHWANQTVFSASVTPKTSFPVVHGGALNEAGKVWVILANT